MRIRTSETGTPDFADALINKLAIGEVQGILINNQGQFSCCVEYIEFDVNESETNEPFTPSALRSKVEFAKAFAIPLYLIEGTLNKKYVIKHIFLDGDNRLASTIFRQDLSADELAQQWAIWKGTRQVKKLHEADERVNATRIDAILDSNGLAWGGNIDGFIIRDSRVAALLEFRFTKKSPLESYDPQKFFHYRGGDWGTWRPLVMAKDILGVPLILLTFEKPNRIGCGIAKINTVTLKDGIAYANGGPSNHIHSTIQTATQAILDLIP